MQDWRASSLVVSELDGITHLHVPRSVVTNEESDRLSWAIVDVTTAIAEDQRLRHGVLITSGGGSFVIEQDGRPNALKVGPAWRQAVAAVAHLECPVIAAIQGDALGPAWQLALACDLRIASAGLSVGLATLVEDGVPIFQPSWALAREAGVSAALAAAVAEPVMSTERAFALGLFTEVVSSERLQSSVEELANRLRRNAPIAAAYAKEAIQRSRDLTLADGMQVEEDLNVLLQTTGDRAEGIDSFLHRRPPQFRGR